MVIIMTQEEKAKAYDKAIEKIKYVMEHGVSPVLNKEDLQDIFPELNESKDEKMRKLTIHHLDRAYQNCKFDEYKNEIENCISWLEKQGENKQILANSAKSCKDKYQGIMQMLQSIYEVLVSINNNQRIPFPSPNIVYPPYPYPTQPWYDTHHVTCTDTNDNTKKDD